MLIGTPFFIIGKSHPKWKPLNGHFPLKTFAPFVLEHSLLGTVHNILEMDVEQ